MRRIRRVVIDGAQPSASSNRSVADPATHQTCESWSTNPLLERATRFHSLGRKVVHCYEQGVECLFCREIVQGEIPRSQSRFYSRE